jgi:hypothetical protein
MPRYDLDPVEPPALPLGPQAYNQAERDRYSNVLRLFFNRVAAFVRNLAGTFGGRFLDFPNGEFSDSRDFALHDTAVAAPIRLNTVTYSHGVSVITDTVLDFAGTAIYATVSDGSGSAGNILSISGSVDEPGYAGMTVTMTGLPAGTYITGVIDNENYYISNSASILTPRAVTITGQSKIQVTYPGRYNFQFSIQFHNLDNSQQDASVWFRHNGTDIANSNSEFGLPARKSAGVASRLIGALNLFHDLEADDYMQIMWRTSDVDLSIEQFPAVAASGTSPAIPATPAVIVTVSFVSRLANT